MTDPRSLLVLFAAVSLARQGAVFLTVWNAGMAAAWRGDTATVGTASLVMMLVIVASVLGGAIGGDR